MTNRPSARYGGVAIAMHWLLAAALTLSFCVGLFMTELQNSPLKLRLYNWHKWAGVTILGLSLLRLAWRWTHRPPPDLPSMPAWQVGAAHGVPRDVRPLLCRPARGLDRADDARPRAFPVVLYGVWPARLRARRPGVSPRRSLPLHWVLA